MLRHSVHDDPRNPQRLLIIEHWDSEETLPALTSETPYMKTFLETAQEFLQGTAEFGFWREIPLPSRHEPSGGKSGGKYGELGGSEGTSSDYSIQQLADSVQPPPEFESLSLRQFFGQR